MVLLIIADDFTGALDTGVQFAAHGIKTRVVVGADAALTHQNADVWWWIPRRATCLPPRLMRRWKGLCSAPSTPGSPTFIRKPIQLCAATWAQSWPPC